MKQLKMKLSAGLIFYPFDLYFLWATN